MWITNALSGAVVFLLGLITRVLKAGYLIAGYNTMPKQEKAKYDEAELTRGIGNLLMIAGVALLLPLVAFPFVDPCRFDRCVVGAVLSSYPRRIDLGEYGEPVPEDVAGKGFKQVNIIFCSHGHRMGWP